MRKIILIITMILCSISFIACKKTSDSKIATVEESEAEAITEEKIPETQEKIQGERITEKETAEETILSVIEDTTSETTAKIKTPSTKAESIAKVETVQKSTSSVEEKARIESEYKVYIEEKLRAESEYKTRIEQILIPENNQIIESELGYLELYVSGKGEKEENSLIEFYKSGLETLGAKAVSNHRREETIFDCRAFYGSNESKIEIMINRSDVDGGFKIFILYDPGLPSVSKEYIKSLFDSSLWLMAAYETPGKIYFTCREENAEACFKLIDKGYETLGARNDSGSSYPTGPMSRTYSIYGTYGREISMGSQGLRGIVTIGISY